MVQTKLTFTLNCQIFHESVFSCIEAPRLLPLCLIIASANLTWPPLWPHVHPFTLTLRVVTLLFALLPPPPPQTCACCAPFTLKVPPLSCCSHPPILGLCSSQEVLPRLSISHSNYSTSALHTSHFTDGWFSLAVHWLNTMYLLKNIFIQV